MTPVVSGTLGFDSPRYAERGRGPADREPDSPSRLDSSAALHRTDVDAVRRRDW